MGVLLFLVLSYILPGEESIGFFFGAIFLAIGGLLLTIIFWIIGIYIDRNLDSFIRFLKKLMWLFGIIIILSLILIAISFFGNAVCLSSDSSCLADKAISENNPKICKKNHQCYTNFILSQQDSTVCASMPEKVDTLGGGVIFYNFKDNCYQQIAYKTNNVELCDFVERIPDRDTCYHHFARKDNNVELCAFVQGEFSRPGCYDDFS